MGRGMPRLIRTCIPGVLSLNGRKDFSHVAVGLDATIHQAPRSVRAPSARKPDRVIPRRLASWSIRSSKGLSRLTATRTGSGGDGPTGTGTWINRLLPVGGHRPIRAETSAVGAGTSSPSSRRASIAVASASDACWAMSPGVVATEATSGRSGDSSDQAPAASSHSAVIRIQQMLHALLHQRAGGHSQPACLQTWRSVPTGCRPSGPQRQPCGHPGGRCDAIPCRLARRSPRAAAAASLHGPSPAYFGRCMTNPIPIGEMRPHGTACITELRSASTPRCSSPLNPPLPAKPAAASRTPSRSPPAPESHPPPPMRPTRPA